MENTRIKWTPVRIALLVVIAAGIAFITLYFLRDKHPRFRAWMDKHIPVNPFNMANIVLKQAQEAHVSQLHPTVQQQFRAFIHEVEKSGWSVICTSSYRSSAKQAQLHAENPKNAKPGHSHHEFGFALDINAVKGTTALRKATATASWEKSGIIDIAKKHGLKWGGYYTNYKDRVHFYKDMNINTLRTAATAQFGSDVKKWKGNEINLG